MNIYTNRMIVILISSVLLGCTSKDIPNKMKYYDGFSISISLDKIAKIPNENKVEYAVYGNIIIQGDNQNSLVKADLGCVSLSLLRESSRYLYIDRVAHVMTTDYKATNNKIDVDVYWVFQKEIKMEDINEFDFTLQDNSDGNNCITLATKKDKTLID